MFAENITDSIAMNIFWEDHRRVYFEIKKKSEKILLYVTFKKNNSASVCFPLKDTLSNSFK